MGLAKIGISPQIVSDRQDLLALTSLQHSRCTLIKLNGDYLDSDRPEFGTEFTTFLDREIHNIYEPTVSKCSLSDRDRLAEFNFQLD